MQGLISPNSADHLVADFIQGHACTYIYIYVCICIYIYIYLFILILWVHALGAYSHITRAQLFWGLYLAAEILKLPNLDPKGPSTQL